MIDLVDKDGSGQIEFDEFLSIIKNSGENEQTQKIKQFFCDLANGDLKADGLSFSMIVTNIRRQYMKDAILCTGTDENSMKRRKQGEKILSNVRRQHDSLRERKRKVNLLESEKLHEDPNKKTVHLKTNEYLDQSTLSVKKNQ